MESFGKLLWYLIKWILVQLDIVSKIVDENVIENSNKIIV